MENEIGNLNKVTPKPKEETNATPDLLVAQEVVQCPITTAARSVVKVDYCKRKCKFFSKFMEDSNRIECKYPRFLEIISVYGALKNERSV